MDTAPHAQTDPAAAVPPASEACQDTQSNACTGKTKSGSRCRTTVGLVDGLCATHRGLVDHRAAAARQHALREEREAAKRREAARSKMTLKEALLERAAEERDAIVDALFAPLSDEDLSPMARQSAARTVLERILGKPGEIAPDEQPADDLPLEVLVEMWREGKRAEAAGTPVAHPEA